VVQSVAEKSVELHLELFHLFLLLLVLRSPHRTQDYAPIVSLHLVQRRKDGLDGELGCVATVYTVDHSGHEVISDRLAEPACEERRDALVGILVPFFFTLERLAEERGQDGPQARFEDGSEQGCERGGEADESVWMVDEAIERRRRRLGDSDQLGDEVERADLRKRMSCVE
jgi:hypothetical protein